MSGAGNIAAKKNRTKFGAGKSAAGKAATEKRVELLFEIGCEEIPAGMLPKVEACLDALRAGVGKVHVIDGRLPHALLLEIYTDRGAGTEIVP